jgi:hypothetical protein
LVFCNRVPGLITMGLGQGKAGLWRLKSLMADALNA